MRFDGVFGVKWVSMGSMWFAEVQSGSQGFFEVHLGSVRFDGAFVIKWGSMGSIWFVGVQYGLQGFNMVCRGSLGLNGVLWVQCGSLVFGGLNGVLSFNIIIIVTSPLHDSRLRWVYDPQPRQTPSVPPSHSPSSPVHPPVPRINDSASKSDPTVPRINKTVPRNVYPPPRKESTAISIAPSSDVRVRAPFTRIESSVWRNSSQQNCPPVPRNNVTDSDGPTAPPPQKRKRNRVNRRERRAREREERAMIDEAFNHDARWNIQSPGALSSTTIPDPLTTIGLPHSEPISAMRPAVYLPVTEQGRPVANENSSSLSGQELRESVGLPPGLYKAPDPDPHHHFRNSSWACSSEDDPPSPTRTSRACSSGARPRTGIIYPLQPRQRRPDTHITVEAASLPEPAALHREELLPAREVPTDLTRPSQRPGRKRRRKRSSAIYRPAKRSPPRGRWCIL